MAYPYPADSMNGLLGTILAAAGGGSSGFSGGGGGGGGGGGFGGGGGAGTAPAGASVVVILLIVGFVLFVLVTAAWQSYRYRKRRAARVRDTELAAAEAATDDAD